MPRRNSATKGTQGEKSLNNEDDLAYFVRKYDDETLRR